MSALSKFPFQIEDPLSLKEWVWKYLKPRNGNPAPRAHLLTINGLTYPIHKVFCFAAVPDPHELTPRKNVLRVNIQRSKRRYSMLSYLHSLRKGDLVFFFQADPQWPKDVFNRRGFRGIWKVVSNPFRDISSIKLPSGYEILGTCPHCQTPFDFGFGGLTEDKKCPLCGEAYGMVNVKTPQGTKKFSRIVLSARVLIEPLVIFERTAGDNRVYSDMSVEPLIWISRTDNAMGAGKGSSIRTLLPEEAAKIAFMLATEDFQRIDDSNCEQKYPGSTNTPIKDHNDVEVKYPRAKHDGRKWILEHEFHLNLYFSLNIDNQKHHLQNVLNIPLQKIDYWTTEFPWGYTGDTSDFVLSCWDDEKGRYLFYLKKKKKDVVDKKALAETLLYVPWVTQILTQFRHETRSIEIIPVIIGKTFKFTRLPKDYALKMKFLTMDKPKSVIVRTPLVIEYYLENIFSVNDVYTGEKQYYAQDISFQLKTFPTTSILPPPSTYTTTEVEKDFVVKRFLNSL